MLKISGIGDNEIFHYQFNLKEAVSTRMLTRLPSNPKNGQKFRYKNRFTFVPVKKKINGGLIATFACSGTEVCLSIFESIDVLLAEISRFFQKV